MQKDGFRNLKRNIEDFGYIFDIEKKNAFFSSLDLFLLPSSHEGMSLTLLEALACQTPIIASPQAVTFDHNNSIIISPRTIEGFVEKIIEFYNKPEMSRNIKKKTLNVASKYSWRNTAELTQNTYEKILL